MFNKFFKILFLISLLSAPTFAAETIMDVMAPKSPAYRLGTSSSPELEYKVKKIETYESQRAKYAREITKSKSYADSTLKELSKELSKTIDIDRDTMVADISVLWAGAASKSETVKFTIYKLSNPDADKPDETIIKKVVRPLAGFSSMAGAGFLNPVAATSAIMSGALINSLSTDDKELNYKYTKVTDADMIMLLKRVDDLQKRLINYYIDYMTTYVAAERAKVNVVNRYQFLELAKNQGRELEMIADAYYRTALERKQSIELDFLSKRAALEQIVGVEAMAEFEDLLKQRQTKVSN
ncbi:MAG: hypothetical protein Q4E87_02410 [bacterium]|nr:hypothetical protein [bacterium]